MRHKVRRKGWMKRKWHSKFIRKRIKRLLRKFKSKPIENSNGKNPMLWETHSESFRLKDFNWQGMLTLKFHSSSFSKNDSNRVGRKNRFEFVEAYMNNLRSKFKITEREFIWVACEEFGESGMGHMHVIFSFDYLKKKHRENKIPRIDFSKDGQFSREANESKDFICRKFKMKTKAVDVKWSPQYDNDGLVSYFCKVEFGRDEKTFMWSKYWRILSNLNAA